MSCPSGKWSHFTYAEALAALVRVDPDGLAPLLGSVYTCRTCGRFTLQRVEGRSRVSWRHVAASPIESRGRSLG